MPCIKVKNGYKIKRGSKKGTYPKVYKSLRACVARVKQMEKFKQAKKVGWKPTRKRK